MKVSLFFSKAQKWVSGAGTNAAVLNLVHYPASAINSALNNARQTELEFQISRSVTLAASNSLQAARATAVLFVEKTRTNLKTYLGERWSTAWAQAGFPNRTLRVPKSSTAGVLSLARALQNYLASNAGQQNALAGVTVTTAGAQVTALENAEKILDNAKRNQRTKRDGRDSTHDGLSVVLANSRSEVESVLDEKDPRWMDFIEKAPGELRAPEAVSAIVAEQGMPGHVRLSFLPSVRAEAYGVYVSTDGGATYPHFETIHDTVADLVLTPGAHVKIRVKASNAAGQSAFSPVAEVTVPVEAAA